MVSRSSGGEMGKYWEPTGIHGMWEVVYTCLICIIVYYLSTTV